MTGTMTTAAVVSMLHESAACNSATRIFRASPVLRWTLDRIARAKRIDNIAVLCWEDQLPVVTPLAEESSAYILAKGPRMALPPLEAISAARRWADGWRGGLLSTCDFDLGFHARWFEEVAAPLDAGALVMVDPSAGLVDPQLIDDAVEHLAQRPTLEMCFMPAAPGLAATVVRIALLRHLASSNAHPGRLLHYMPEQPVRDPIGGEGCVAVPTPVARTTARFKLDSDRQIARLAGASVSLNGQLISTGAEELVHRVHAFDSIDPLPREVVLELNTQRATSPIFWPGKHLQIQREPMSLERARRLFDELAAMDDMRLTIAGVGDPLLAPQFEQIIAAAREAGIAALHLETDLLPRSLQQVQALAELDIDVISIHVPALTEQTYAAVMGVDRYREVLENIHELVKLRHERGRGTPLVAPLFTKCSQNLGEMESWYDQWLAAVGSAVIVGPGDYARQIPATGVAEMAPPRRRACARLRRRLTVLSDGAVVACEQDVLGRHSLGRIGEVSVSEIWQKRLAPLRADHAAGNWAGNPLCGACSEWHRP